MTDFLDTLGTPPRSARVAVERLTTLQTRLRSTADRLAAINPPEDIKAEHERLVAAMHEFADELDPVIAEVRRGKLAPIATVTSLKGVAEIQAAALAIAKQGYVIGS
jgi:transposase